MKAIRLQEPGDLALISQPPPPRPGPGEALVRVGRVGICGTDLHAYRGRQPFFSYPRILGHELGVEVLALGSIAEDNRLAVGDRCAVEPYFNCGRCSACRRSKTNCCAHLQVLGVHTDGGMREEILVPANKLHPSPTLPLEHLALVETLCIGAHAVGRATLEPDETVLVVGAGPIGLTVIQFALLAGARVAVLELDEHRRRFCRQHFALEQVLDGQGDVEASLRTVHGGDLPVVVFDASGNSQAMEKAFGYVEQGGRLVLVGLVQADITFHDPEFHRREMTLLSSRNATAGDFRRVIAHLEAGDIDLAPWITHHATPETIAAEMPRWLQPENHAIKAMLAFDSPS